MSRAILVLVLCAAFHSTSWAYFYSYIVPFTNGYKSWVKVTNQSWTDWNTRVALGQINFPTNLETPLAFPTANGMGCEVVIPMDDVANDEEFVQSPIVRACPKDAHTLPEDSVLWINPDNWRPSLSVDIIRAVPHVERIPCTHDMIRFSGLEKDFVVVLPNKNVSILRMTYEGIIVSVYNYKSVLKKENFLKHFIVHGAHDVTDLLTFTGTDCGDPTGCVCGTMQFYDEICEIMKPKCNLTLPCLRPFQPVGHCCEICGLSVQIIYDPQRFVMKKLYSMIFQKLLYDYGSLNVHWYLSKISDGIAQLIIVHDNESDTRDLYVLTIDLIRSMLEVENLGITTYTVTSSGSSHDPQTWYKAVRIAFYVIGSAALFIVGYFLCTIKNRQVFRYFAKNSAQFEKLDSTIGDGNNLQKEQAEKTEDDSACKYGKSAESAGSGAESESDDVFVELQATSEDEESPSSQSKEFEEVEILLDIPGCGS